MFNKKEFRNLILLAIGEKTTSEFAEISGVNRTYISKYLNNRLDNPPSPEILQKIANVANSNVTYADLMLAAGYIDFDKDNTTSAFESTSSKSFSNRLKHLRTEKGILQRELADYLSVSRVTITQYEAGSRSPDDEIKKKIGKYFNVSLDYLMGASNIRNPSIENNVPEQKDYSITNEYLEIAKELQNESIRIDDIRCFIDIIKRNRIDK